MKGQIYDDQALLWDQEWLLIFHILKVFIAVHDRRVEVYSDCELIVSYPFTTVCHKVILTQLYSDVINTVLKNKISSYFNNGLSFVRVVILLKPTLELVYQQTLNLKN